MTESFILYELGIIVVGAVAFVLVLRAARVPNIVAYILAGLTLGPITGIIGVTEAVDLISEFGIALLLFLVGLELSIEKIKDLGPVAVGAGIGQVVFTTAGAQISEFSFIFATLGLGAGLIDHSTLSLIALVGLTTIAIRLPDFIQPRSIQIS